MKVDRKPIGFGRQKVTTYKVDSESDIPIYQQLSDRIASDIKSGVLKPGDKLPTVRDLAEELCLAKGTIKRAYDELCREDLVEMTQGRGTFVRYRPMNSKSRKERAMAAIDQMLETLRELSLSPEEMRIFVELKLRECLQHGNRVRIGFVECSPEILGQIADRLREYPQIEVSPYLLEDILRYPYKIADDTDLVITSATHAAALEEALPNSKNLVKMALAMRPQCVRNIAQLNENAKVGVCCRSERFFELLSEVMKSYTAAAVPKAAFFFGQGDLAAYLEEKDAVLVPANYENFCSVKEVSLLEKFSARHILVLCSYQADQGSLYYLDERLQAVLEKRKLK